ncbi:transcription factor kayak-like isoform X2 [Oppia nitens]|nr:transcription factor kayak-like isoform X2 [Oppia nitens]
MEIIPPQPRTHPQEARFMPPLVNISANYVSIHSNNAYNEFNNNSSNNSNSNTSDYDMPSDDYETDEDSSSRSESKWNAYVDRNSNANQMQENGLNNKETKVTVTKTRGRSGRKPMRNDKLTPEEEKKRHQRRERNKQAAARCRKRRMDHTNTLLIETEGLEDKKQSLLKEMELLQKQKEELEYILSTHKMSNCKMHSSKLQEIDVKPVVSNGSVVTINSNFTPKLRPNTLSLNTVYGDSSIADSGIPIQTPSTGLFLEALSETGTGLTPVLTPVITPSSLTSNSYNIRNKLSPNQEKKLTHL